MRFQVFDATSKMVTVEKGEMVAQQKAAYHCTMLATMLATMFLNLRRS